jgi:DNA-binding sugar fermentation-stimulating protein
MNNIVLFELDFLEKAIIINRPSKIIKSPFVADINLISNKNKIISNKEENKRSAKINNNTNYLAHTPALGCCGLADKGSIVYVKRLESLHTKCDYQILLSEIITKNKKIIIGIAPKLGELIAEYALLNNLVDNLEILTLDKQKTFLNSRFDFSGKTKDNQNFICEVKNVPLADFCDNTMKEKQKLDFSNYKYNEKISYFPDGYRKKKNDPVSPRALKHIRELTELKIENKNLRTILLFIIQREDVSSFQPSILDQTYLEAIREGHKKGVEIKTIQVKWKKNKAIFLNNKLPINLINID